MARALVCLGDKTSYGIVVLATASWYEGNKPVAQTGDKATCSKCKGAFPIIASGVDWGEKQPYAATGDRVACGCSDHYVYGSASQYTSTAPGSLISRNTNTSSLQLQKVQNRDSRHHIRHLCVDDNGQVLAGCRYTIIFPDGSVEADITDEQGYTRWHFSETTDNINLHILMD